MQNVYCNLLIIIFRIGRPKKSAPSSDPLGSYEAPSHEDEDDDEDYGLGGYGVTKRFRGSFCYVLCLSVFTELTYNLLIEGDTKAAPRGQGKAVGKAAVYEDENEGSSRGSSSRAGGGGSSRGVSCVSSTTTAASKGRGNLSILLLDMIDNLTKH